MALRLQWTISVIIVLAFVNVAVCPRCKFNSTERQSQLASKYASEMKCNDAYYMLLYLHVTNPENLSFSQVKNVHDEINANYLGWPEKMLVTAFNVAQTGTEMDLQWLVYLYVNRIVVHTTSIAYDLKHLPDFLPVMQTSHKWMLAVLSIMTEKDCAISDPVAMCERELSEYKRDVSAQNPVELLIGHWDNLCQKSRQVVGFLEANENTAPVPGVQPVCEENLTLKLLYLNDVFENEEGEILLKQFGVIEKGHVLIPYLRYDITRIKSGRTTFKWYVRTLSDFHEHVLHAIHTMMLRIYYHFVENLKKIKKINRRRNVDQFFKPFNQWCVFMGVPKTDFLYKKPKSCFGFLLDGTVRKLQGKLIERLTEIDGKSWVVPAPDNHTKISLAQISLKKCKLETLIGIAGKYDITLDTTFNVFKRPSIGQTIFLAEVLTKYLEKIFTGINFKVVSSLAALRNSKILKYSN